MSRRRATVEDRVDEYAMAHCPYELRPTWIARKLHLNPATVRKVLFRLVRKELIVRTKRGDYRCKNAFESRNGATYPMPMLHGIKLEYRGEKCHDIYTKSYLESLFPGSPIKEHPKNHSLSVFYSIAMFNRIIPFSITVHSNLLEVWFKQGKEEPLSVGEMLYVAGYICGVFRIPPNKFKITQIRLNIDVRALQLDGSNITLAELNNALVRVYQHGKHSRFEVHRSRSAKRDENIETLKELIEILKYGINGKAELNATAKFLKKILSEIYDIKELVLNIMDIQVEHIYGNEVEVIGVPSIYIAGGEVE